MRLTNSLQHAKRFWWGKGWGARPRVNTDNFYYQMQWNAKRRRAVEVVAQTLPENAAPVDPNLFVKRELRQEFNSERSQQFNLPWPYSNRPVKGSSDDPSYKADTALVYQRHKRLIEPMNLPLNFTNSALEEGLPQRIVDFQNGLSVDENTLEVAKRRMNWCLNNDAAMRKLPLRREFPYLDQRPPRMFGITDSRKENHLLLTLHDLANSFCSKNYGPNFEIVGQRVTNPHCVLPLERDHKKIILDLECDFVTLLQHLKSDSSLEIPQFSTQNESNSPPSVTSIHPLSWEVAFDSKNMYCDDFQFELPSHSAIQTIYLSNNSVRTLQDEDYCGRAIMFCYGYAVQQAKLQFKTENLSDIQLKKPISIQCVFSNPTNFKVGAVFFQLNTLDHTDSNILNRVWVSQPHSVVDDLESVLKSVISVNANGIHF